MSIWQDDKGRTHVGVMVAGKRIHRVVPKGASASDAKQLEAALTGAAVKKKTNVPGDPMLSEVMALYMEHAESLRSPETAKHHARRIGPWVAKYRASDTKTAVRHFVKDAKKKYAAATINWSLSCLKKGLELAYDDELTPVNYSDVVKTLPVHNVRDTTITLAQAKKLASCASKQVAAAMWISLYTGCRRGEVLKMVQADISGDTMLIHAGNTKTLKTRTIPVVAQLRPWLAYVPLKLNAEGLKSGWERARIKAGMEHVNFHDLRRSCATLMIEAGVDLYVVSKLLGHSSVTVTQTRYGHLQTERIAAGLKTTFGE